MISLLKTKVVLFGQSAGAIDTFTIATLDQAPKLINAAIMESGGGNDYATTAEAEAYGQEYVMSLGCKIDDVFLPQSHGLLGVRC